MVAAIKVGADWLADTKGINDPSKRAEEVGRARTAVLAVLAGGIAVVGAYYTHLGFRLSRQGQITERFTRAVDQLGSASRDVRIGGIYALERLARESRDDHGPIVEILTAFVRERCPFPEPEAEEAMVQHDPERYPEPPGADVGAALTVLGRREVGHDPEPPWRLDLSRAYLPKVNLGRTNLASSDLSFSSLSEAFLSGANLEKADLRGTRLYNCRLRGATLIQADLTRVWGAHADLNGARLDAAQLNGARFSKADLRGSSLRGASVEGADFAESLLDGASFQDARFSSATGWPVGFDPVAAGAIAVDTDD